MTLTRTQEIAIRKILDEIEGMETLDEHDLNDDEIDALRQLLNDLGGKYA